MSKEMRQHINKFNKFRLTENLDKSQVREGKYSTIEHKHTINTYLEEIADGLENIDDTSKLEDIEHQLSHIIYKYILD